MSDELNLSVKEITEALENKDITYVTSGELRHVDQIEYYKSWDWVMNLARTDMRHVQYPIVNIDLAEFDKTLQKMEKDGYLAGLEHSFTEKCRREARIGENKMGLAGLDKLSPNYFQQQELIQGNSKKKPIYIVTEYDKTGQKIHQWVVGMLTRALEYDGYKVTIEEGKRLVAQMEGYRWTMDETDKPYSIILYGFNDKTREIREINYQRARMTAERVGGTYECEDGPYAEKIEIFDEAGKLVAKYPVYRGGAAQWD